MAVFKPKTRKMVTVNRGGTVYQREQEVNVDQPSAASQERLGRIAAQNAHKFPLRTDITAIKNSADLAEEERLTRQAYFDHRLDYDEAFSGPGPKTTTVYDRDGQPHTNTRHNYIERIEIPRDDSLSPGDRVQVDGKWFTIDKRLSDDYVDGGVSTGSDT